MKAQPSDNILAFTGIRAVACTMVMLCHCAFHGFGFATVLTEAGTPAVYLFFVLSGYLLMRRGLFEIQSSIDDVPQRFLSFKLIYYLIRRLMRIYPGYVVAIPAYKTLMWYARSRNHNDDNVEVFDRSFWKSLYFSGIDSHFWTLRIELIFFLAFLPIILVLTAELKVLDHKYLRHSRIQSSGCFYLITTILITYLQYQNGKVRGGWTDRENFWLHLRAFWHGCLGGIASYHFNIYKLKSINRLNKWTVELITWGIVLRLVLGNPWIIWSHTSMNRYKWWHHHLVLTPFKAALLFILEFTHETNSIARALSLPLFQLLGKISYSTYLFHVLVFILFKMHITIRGAEGYFEVIALSFFFGAVLYHAVEKTGVKYGEELIRWLKNSSQIHEETPKRELTSSETSSNKVTLSEIELKSH